ncbi:hypothetical protein C8R44DRAFT_737216 [Mycena epipterygia]|nr:hypothetical protein C8R44DRAFT_737216 [Mycena epipterygia]
METLYGDRTDPADLETEVIPTIPPPLRTYLLLGQIFPPILHRFRRLWPCCIPWNHTEKRSSYLHLAVDLGVGVRMTGDHTSNEKNTAKGLKEWKHEEAVNERPSLRNHSWTWCFTCGWNAKKVAEVSGITAWDMLSDGEKAEHDKKLMQEIATALGKEAYDALSPEDHRAIDLFVWGGCCMHKDLNSFKGRNTEMMLEWGKIGFRAFQASTRGGVKICALAGAIFNHKDDKKGQADKHVDFMTRKTGKPHSRFPDTSNARFGTFGGASAELITYILEYLDMMDLIQWSKTNPSLTNIEKHLRDALKNPATLTELCAMILYQQIISHAFLRQVRGPGTENVNLLDLGPLHTAVRDHIQKILDNPDLIFGEDMLYEMATLDGRQWHDPKAVKAVVDLMSSLPHPRTITLAVFRGALTTWVRFSAEFAPGGVIDQCSAAEKQLAWMPSTNDANEGALGGYRVGMGGKPSLTLHQYNSLAMYLPNDTQAFMDAVLTEADHTYIIREARKIDASGAEALWHQEIVDFRIKTAEMHKQKGVAAARKALEIRHELRKVDALKAALKIYLANIGKYPLPPDPEADMESEVSTLEVETVEEWVDEEDAEMQD